MVFVRSARFFVLPAEASAKEGAFPPMLARHAVLSIPAISLRLSLSCCNQNKQSSFHSPYTLPSSVSRKSFACHSYENCRGVYQQFPFWNYELCARQPVFLPLCALCIRRLPRQGRVTSALAFSFNFQLWTLNRNLPPTYLLSSHTLAHSFAQQKTQPFSFQSFPHSLSKNTRGGGRGVMVSSRRSVFSAPSVLSPIASFDLQLFDRRSRSCRDPVGASMRSSLRLSAKSFRMRSSAKRVHNSFRMRSSKNTRLKVL
jgi:hypothetical protein